jgi:hypothetical protein
MDWSLLRVVEPKDSRKVVPPSHVSGRRGMRSDRARAGVERGSPVDR